MTRRRPIRPTPTSPRGTVDAGLLLHIVADATLPEPVALFGIPFVPTPDNTGTNNSNGTDRVTNGYNERLRRP